MGLLSYDAGPNYLLLRGPFTDRGMTRLARLDGLFALNLDASELGITAAGLAPLVGLPNLGWLAADAKDSHMPLIAQMPRLRFLGCQDTIAGDDGFAALSQSQSIEYIWGRRCYNLRTRGFMALARMPALRGLSVSCKNVDDAGIAELPKFRSLRELMPMDVPDLGYRHIARCEGLESLVLMYCRETGDAATEQIVQIAGIEVVFRELHANHGPHAGAAFEHGIARAGHLFSVRGPDQFRGGPPGPAAAVARVEGSRARDHRGNCERFSTAGARALFNLTRPGSSTGYEQTRQSRRACDSRLRARPVRVVVGGGRDAEQKDRKP